MTTLHCLCSLREVAHGSLCTTRLVIRGWPLLQIFNVPRFFAFLSTAASSGTTASTLSIIIWYDHLQYHLVHPIWLVDSHITSLGISFEFSAGIISEWCLTNIAFLRFGSLVIYVSRIQFTSFKIQPDWSTWICSVFQVWPFWAMIAGAQRLHLWPSRCFHPFDLSTKLEICQIPPLRGESRRLFSASFWLLLRSSWANSRGNGGKTTPERSWNWNSGHLRS